MRDSILLLLLASSASLAQTPTSAMPVTPPTAGSQPTAVPASSLKTSDRTSHRAEVVYAEGELRVTASNSSLNQILREVARQTGMKITGGVSDERVFGKFGPASPSEVLATLLDGTDSNMLLRASSSSVPAELILTPRGGGPTPPNPNAAAFEDEPPTSEPALPPAAPTLSATPTPAVVQQSGPQPLPFSAPVPTPAITSTQMTPQTPPPGGIIGAPTVAPATEPGTTPGPDTQSTGTSDSRSTGAKTPQQIYLQLQKLQQQQQANPN